MSAAFDAVFVVVFMVAAVWVVGFGVGCVLLAHGSRWGRAAAFCVGALFGPAGLVIIGYSRREERSAPRHQVTQADPFGSEPIHTTWSQVDGPPGASNPLRPPD